MTKAELQKQIVLLKEQLVLADEMIAQLKETHRLDNKEFYGIVNTATESQRLCKEAQDAYLLIKHELIQYKQTEMKVSDVVSPVTICMYSVPDPYLDYTKFQPTIERLTKKRSKNFKCN